jgi:hypothetical protein
MRSPEGKFALGPVRTDYVSDHVGINRRIPEGWTVAADMHSHPCVPNGRTDVFSESDLITGITTRTVGYMVDLCTGDVHEFVPGERVDEIEIDTGLFLTGGKIIGHVPAFPNDCKANEGF